MECLPVLGSKPLSAASERKLMSLHFSMTVPSRKILLFYICFHVIDSIYDFKLTRPPIFLIRATLFH